MIGVMPKQLIFALFIEVCLIVLTSLLLMRPTLIFTNPALRVSEVSRIGGMVLLCTTFCWSVVLGALLTLSSIVIRL